MATFAKVKNLRYAEQRNSIEFQNNNSFGISGVLIGFTQSNHCHDDPEKYEYTTLCANSDTKDGVSSVSFGRLPCNEVPRAAKTMGFCSIGYSPVYGRFTTDSHSLVEFMESQALCK